MNILGVSAFYHDSAAALIRDGEIIAAAQEERFTRLKGDARFPKDAVDFCLSEGKIDLSQLDHVVFYENPMLKWDRLLETQLAYAPKGFRSFVQSLPRWAGHRLKLPAIIRSEIGVEFKGELWFVNHHDSHAASAFFPSPFEEAAILTLDAVGEWATSSIGYGRGNRITLTREMRFPHSLGMLYSAFTYYSGFQVNSGEYKLMGLAPYGEPKYVDVILDHIVKIHEDGSLWMDMSYFDYCHGQTMTSQKFHALFGGPPRKPESFITQKEMDLAASIQSVCEEAVLRAGRHIQQLTGMRDLVMAGGVALNCVANGRLLREGPFENIWVQPAAGDAGGALGAAFFAWHHYLNKPRQVNRNDCQKASLLGPRYDDVDIECFLDSVSAIYEHVAAEPELIDQVARLMANGKIVGWFHGRMEFGPRALGARSIIGDARSPSMQQTMNLKIKYRESFRPFAPCVLREYAHEYFDVRGNENSPYMLLVAPVREQWRVKLGAEELARMKDPDLRIRVSVPRSSIPAVTHVDYSARVQTVDEEKHGRYYRLMRRFYDLTGCPVIVNTSFNIRGEPILCTPEQAYRCFMATDIDCLVLENYLLLKDRQPAALLEDAEAYKAQYALD